MGGHLWWWFGLGVVTEGRGSAGQGEELGMAGGG
jgi:hypothetical protein